jgi:phosphoserine phosphatase
VNDAPPPYRTVLFDCDSTLADLEGIDELAARAGVDVRRETERAMAGEIPLEAVYGARLAQIRPTRSAVEAVGDAYVERAAPHAAELVAALRALDKHVAIVSGGLAPAVRVLARALAIDSVHAVEISFAGDGTYAGFDERSPLARAGGKLELVRARRPAAPAVLVGDGVTDLEAAPALARFVAFGGFARRASVFAAARAHCDAPDLAALLPLLCSADEIEALAADRRHAPLVEAARSAANASRTSGTETP